MALENPKILHDNRLDDATPVASDTDADTQYDVLNLRDWRPYTFWKPSTVGAGQSIGVDPGFSGNVDYLYMSAHDVFSNHCCVQIRVYSGAAYTGTISTYSSNLIEYPDDFANADWIKRGTCTVTANDALAPDGTRTADLISGLGANGVDDIYNYSPNALLNDSNPVEPSLWIKRVSTSGVLSIEQAQTENDGAWTVDLSLLSNDWERITRDHPAVTVVNEWRQTPTTHQLGMLLHGPASPISLHAWRANLQACVSGDRRTTPFSNAHVDVPIFIPFSVVNGLSFQVWVKLFSGSGVPSIGIVAFGQALAMPRGLPIPYDPIGRQIRGQVNRSVAGHPLGKVIEFEEFSRTLNFRHVSWDFVRDTWLPAWNAHLRSEPFGLIWEPGEHPEEVYLVTAGNGFQTPHQPGEFTDLQFDVTGVAA